MYSHQIQQLKESIINSNGFEACRVENPSFNRIKIRGIRKLPSEINQGRHHVFIDLGNYRGQEFRAKLNDGTFYPFTKPTNEVACHIDIYGQNNKIQILGFNGEHSQVITNLDFNHTDAGHSSYYVYAEIVNEVTQPEAPTQPPIPNPVESEIVTELRNVANTLKQVAATVERIISKI